MFGVIDRFEEGFAVVEMDEGGMVNAPLWRIPKEAKEGDILEFGDTVTIDARETEKRKKEVENLLKDTWVE
ncbi:MAG: DUF3006 domain-containing protein [Bacillota bacterium]|nr:DUF3006 domain-containing protein [Bacillota bacterium]